MSKNVIDIDDGFVECMLIFLGIAVFFFTIIGIISFARSVSYEFVPEFMLDDYCSEQFGNEYEWDKQGIFPRFSEKFADTKIGCTLKKIKPIKEIKGLAVKQ